MMMTSSSVRDGWRLKLQRVNRMLRSEDSSLRWLSRIQRKIILFMLSQYGNTFEANDVTSEERREKSTIVGKLDEKPSAPLKNQSDLAPMLKSITEVNEKHKLADDVEIPAYWGFDFPRERPRGFDLLCALLALIPISLLVCWLLASSMSSGYFSARQKAARTRALQASYVTQAQNGIATLQFALDKYRRDFGHYPPLANLGLLINDPGDPLWKGPYLNNQQQLTDPWGVYYRLEPRMSGYRIRSAGPDLIFNTGDDISN